MGHENHAERPSNDRKATSPRADSPAGRTHWLVGSVLVPVVTVLLSITGAFSVTIYQLDKQAQSVENQLAAQNEMALFMDSLARVVNLVNACLEEGGLDGEEVQQLQGRLREAEEDALQGRVAAARRTVREVGDVVSARPRCSLVFFMPPDLSP